MSYIMQRFLKPLDAAKFCALSVSTLAKRRLKGLPPEYRKVGRAVLYDITDLERFLEEHRCRSTSEAVQP
jgi:hypothetical protein